MIHQHRTLCIDYLKLLPISVENLEVKAGVTALAAPSGSGKSRFVRAVADLLVNSGAMRLGDTQREEVSAPAWRKLVRYVSPEPSWWGATVRENIPQDDVTVMLCNEFGVAPKLMDSPIADLSSGERQRFGLIRALHDDPPVLLLDEPTAALDEVTSRKVEAELRRRGDNGRIILLISHSKAQIERIADGVLTIENGQVVERI